MILPIVAFGDPVLRKVTEDIPKDTPVNLRELADNMFETMYKASGVGLAAPQVGYSLRLFVVDGTPIIDGEEEDSEDFDPSLVNFKKAFVNPEILEEEGEEWAYEEGCLSIPGIRADVLRPERLKIRYFDLDWNEHIEDYEGIAARIIQHEYDHLEGILFTDHLPPLKRTLLKKKMSNITKGEIRVDYKMKFPK
ncbi:peptide deformylase [Siphonobacter aquaeclarae]|jgi:peptide deformylase|uniref:Peptide deformylase n=1 Tax=Siphonobacter aquaeclarae TaxID=563176 RepID=A0A1G9W5P7_9BACT|nr:peptide deformylase [Siphonobacter aquaeclarae]MBO9639458.1 peptide deformylase [Siphonobacter aquaeclarae]SDM79838.1 peptide deformylase [Siphonobacter aquaeclarae]